MKGEQLNTKWEQISASNIVKGYKSLRINASCYSDIYLAIDEQDNHCLILILPIDYELKFRVIKKDKISLEYFSDKNYVVMTLLDNEFNGLFDDLILSIYNAIKDIEKVEVYSKVFIQTFHQWVLFFSPEYSTKLSKDIIKGIFGELIVLRELVLSSGWRDINETLLGWVGPYDQTHDFVYLDKNIEVKTKDDKQVSVRISSEHQLTIEEGKKLIMSVVSVSEDLINGASLKMLVKELKVLTFEMFGDFSIVLKALHQKGLTLQNVSCYDNYRFKAMSLTDFDCSNEGFPKITLANLPPNIANVTYDLNISKMSKFKIQVREL